MHAYHQGLPGYDERQILHDGCNECERRGERVLSALNNMDGTTFARAWERAWEWNNTTMTGRHDLNISVSEANLLRILYAVRVQMNNSQVEA